MHTMDYKYIILLACLVLGPLVIIYNLTSKYLWYRPVPTLQDIIVIPGRGGTVHGNLANQYYLQEGANVTISPSVPYVLPEGSVMTNCPRFSPAKCNTFPPITLPAS